MAANPRSSPGSFGFVRPAFSRRISGYRIGTTSFTCICRLSALRSTAKRAEARPFTPICIRYLGGFNDELLRKGGASLVAEMRAPTSSGRLLADCVAVALTARIAEQYASGVRRGARAPPRHKLTELRLRRVLQFMAEHLEADIGLDELAAVAGLSVFHFARSSRTGCGSAPTPLSRPDAAGTREDPTGVGPIVIGGDFIGLLLLFSAQLLPRVPAGDWHNSACVSERGR